MAHQPDLSREEWEVLTHREALWQRAHEVAASNRRVDVGDVFHALQCLELSPAERLRRSFQRGRLRAYAR